MTFLFELRIGTFIPRVGDEPGLTSNPYTTVFGNKSMLRGRGVRHHPLAQVRGGDGGFRRGLLGDLRVGAAAEQRLTLHREDRAVRLPAPLPVGYRFDVTWTKWGIPFVPYVKLALLATYWNATKGGTTEVVNGESGNGLQVGGWGATGGIAFMLDILSPSMAKDMHADTGIRHTYVFAEYNYDQVTDFGKNVLNLSSRYFIFGLGFEF